VADEEMLRRRSKQLRRAECLTCCRPCWRLWSNRRGRKTLIRPH